MKDLRTEYIKSWHQAKKRDGDFMDCLLHYLSINLDMPVVNPKTEWTPTDGGVIEMGGSVSNGDADASAKYAGADKTVNWLRESITAKPLKNEDNT